MEQEPSSKQSIYMQKNVVKLTKSVLFGPEYNNFKWINIYKKKYSIII